ncbi:MAG TPA: DUF2075 domain-containing protein [Elusimicrobiales bacterium]|nr:DUF2075 domain-containing protein [Elusimicrobiales bacterium]
MIIYSATKSAFIDDVFQNVIVDKLADSLRARHVPGTNPAHLRSYQNSLRFMETVLHDPSIPDDAGIAIEYVIPSSAKRVDFIITGADDAGPTAVLVELKQWSQAGLTHKDAVVTVTDARGRREAEHPSYQAWSYAALLEDFNQSVRANRISLRPCAYLHNYAPDGVLTHPFYAEHTGKAPVFLKHDAAKLRDFIRTYVRRGDAGETIYVIENGRIRPSKSLADCLASMLKGNREFVMIDDQKLVYETALDLLNKRPKQVLIVEGGPGTGKSVVAVNLLVAAIEKRLNAQYITKNAAPRAVYQARLTGKLTRGRIASLFCGSGKYTACPKDTFDMLVVDEAHRLNAKSGMMQNLGENQVKEIIHSAKCSVFFLDEDQRVTLRDIGERREIERWARHFRAEVHHMELASQFRCSGSQGYLAWLDNALQKRDTANITLAPREYDFRVVDSAAELRDIIFDKNKPDNKARLVAGYCWDWVSKTDPSLTDINIPGENFAMKWNLASDGSLWIINPDSVNEVGCIHTCQGLELDYIGVIVGPDLVCRDGRIKTDPSKRARTDASVKGYKRMAAADPAGARREMDNLIKNTYKTLMTRGVKGCYVYCTDKETADHFRSLLAPAAVPAAAPAAITGKIKRALEILRDIPAAGKWTDYLPVYTLEAACGGFGRGMAVEPQGWAKSPPGLKPDRNMFIARVTGRSMEPKLHDGDYCVFRANVAGTRQGKIVLVQHSSISDPDTGGSYTVM